MFKREFVLPCLLILTALTSTTLFAQEIKIQKQIIGSPQGEIMLPTFDVITANGFVDAKTVKGAPFAAEFSSEAVQTLADGNRIVRRSSTNVYRDAEGRTRREQTFSTLGVMIPAGSESARRVFIFDPVTNTNYTLNPLGKTAFRSKVFVVTVDPANTKLLVPELLKVTAADKKLADSPELKKRLEEMEKNFEKMPRPEPPREEQLGAREIEGVAADGKRVTTVIPAGMIGNEQPIEIVRETWYSKELQMVVMSVQKNPLTGEQTYKMTKFSRGDQPRSLFEVPNGFRIVDGSKMLNQLTDVPTLTGDPMLQIFGFPGGAEK